MKFHAAPHRGGDFFSQDLRFHLPYRDRKYIAGSNGDIRPVTLDNGIGWIFYTLAYILLKKTHKMDQDSRSMGAVRFVLPMYVYIKYLYTLYVDDRKSIDILKGFIQWRRYYNNFDI